MVGVVITSPRSTTGYKFEIDFQKDPSLCSGAIVRAADRPGDRMLVVYGYGHAYLLRQFAAESGAFRVVDVASVLEEK